MKPRFAGICLYVALALAIVSCAAASTPTPGPGLPLPTPVNTLTNVPPTRTVSATATTLAPTLAISASPTTSSKVAPSATPAQVQKDLTYCTMGGIPVKMDLYPPTQSDGKLAPVVIYIHGGGWTGGDKSLGEGIQVIPFLAARGYFFVSINYRLAPQYKWPAQIQDSKCAIRYLRANAVQYNIDPNGIGAIGASAGGHLVALLGLTDKSAGFDVGQYLDQPSNVQAVVDLFGPTDLMGTGFTLSQMGMAKNVFGVTSPNDPILAQASPVTYVNKNAPPFLILQGEKDTTVPPQQSQELYDRLKAAGVPATLIMVKNAEHSFVPKGGPIQPNLLELFTTITNFYDKYLRNP